MHRRLIDPCNEHLSCRRCTVVAGPGMRFVLRMGAVQGALIRSQFGVGETQCIVADDSIELLAVQCEIQLALRICIVDKRAVIAINRVDSVGVYVSDQAIIFNGNCSLAS